MIRFATLLFLLACTPAFSQDLHFSQFYLHPLQFNPAQTGVIRGNVRVSGIYRSQWTSVPVSYRTFGAAADTKLWDLGANTLSAGLTLQHDKAGDAGLTWTQGTLGAGLARPLSASQSLSVGFGLSFVQRAFDITRLKFKNQWANDAFDANAPTRESFNQSSGIQPSWSAGLHWRFKHPDKRTSVDAGAGAAHLNRPKVSFADIPEASLPIRLAVVANSAIELNEFYDLVVFALGQRMGKAGEIVAGAGVRWWLIPGEYALQLTLAARPGDAIIPAVQVERGNWTVGVSYDWNTSPFEAATRGRGGFEIALVYRDLPVPPVKKFKSCPVF